MAQIVPNGGKSPEEIAYRLLENIAFTEGQALSAADGGSRANKTWVLSTYAECLGVVRDAFYIPKE
jgi:hypothetical protein